MKKLSYAVPLALALAQLCALLSGCGASGKDAAPAPTAAVTAAPADPAPTAAPQAEPEPEPSPEPSVMVTLPDGSQVDSRAAEVDLSELSDLDLEEALDCLDRLPELKLIELGQERPELSWESVRRLVEARGGADINFAFKLCGKQFHLADTRMDLNHIPMDDDGALVKRVVVCMPNLISLDMDSCGVGDEDMAAIRDSIPEAKVVWRIWFGETYSVRTDVERILASKPSRGGTLFPETLSGLKYCTQVKYLDMGYNTVINDIGFLAYMPKLEVAILAKNNFSDLSPLENCPELNYLEIQSTNVSDLSPLSELKKLKHLNLCSSQGVRDLSPIYGLSQLERLWLGGYTAVPAEGIAAMQAAVPDCLINTTANEAFEGMWRAAEVGSMFPLHPRYIQLLEEFGDYSETAYSYSWNDPLYEGGTT